MKSARNQLILLGIICQGFTWDDWFMPMLGLLVWVCGLTFCRRIFKFPQALDAVALIAGTVLAYAAGNVLGKNTHFFIGHGLSVLQCVRLTRNLSYKEQCVSVMIALFHLGVVCTFLFDIRFIPVLLALIYLIPKALTEIATLDYATENVTGTVQQPVLARETVAFNDGHNVKPYGSMQAGWSTGVYGVITLIMLLFFLVFPRGNLSSAIGPRRAGMTEPGTIFSSMMDPTKSVLAQSSRVFMHVEGEQLNYFRLLTMTDFDGVNWSKRPRGGKRIQYLSGEELSGFMRRRISVKNASFLGKILPCDGPIANLGGNFFARSTVNDYGDLECQVMWNTANNIYEYWIPKERNIETLYPGLIYWHTNFPPQSQRLHAWVNQIVSGISDPWLQARALEAHLQTNFTYELGGPELNRLNPVDDFVFNQKRGHCERFASALTLMLRMKGIPSRVVVGFVPGVRNLLSGGYNIRYNDAHAWTEAYFQNRGWVQMDATPRSSMGDRYGWRTLLDDFDLAWAMYVVNYDAPTQSQLFSTIMSTVGQAAQYLEQASIWLLFVLMVSAVVLLIRKWNRRTANKSKGHLTPAETTILANHCYADMMLMLSARGFRREANQTPMEFLTSTAHQLSMIYNSVAYVTRLFCRVRYGAYAIDANEQNKLTNELQQIRLWVRRPTETK